MKGFGLCTCVMMLVTGKVQLQSATVDVDSETTSASPLTLDYLNCTLNTSTQVTPNLTLHDASTYADWQVALIAVACGILAVGTVIGNLLVVTAVVIVRRLRTPSNLLIVSLAISDLLVALLVMPFAAMYEAMGRWVLGHAFCDVWTSLDVLLCTASILNLCAISVDRYFVITRPFQYAIKRTPSRMAAMIAAVWVLSGVISIPPLFGWKAKNRPGECVVSQDIGYQFYATIGAFYLPLTIMIVIYVRIYLVSSRIARAEALSKPSIEPAVAEQRTSLTPTIGSEITLRKDSSLPNHSAASPANAYDLAVSVNGQNNAPATKRSRAFSVAEFIPAVRRRSTFAEHRRLFQKSRFSKISSSHERKATKTLGVIMGAFTACWLPFFILALIKPFCYDQESCIPYWLGSLFLWLGYANSFLNPIIYARFNRDFRTPFMHILQCHVHDINSRLRSENYTEQYGGMIIGPRPSVAGPDMLQYPRDSMTSAVDARLHSTSRRLRVTDVM